MKHLLFTLFFFLLSFFPILKAQPEWKVDEAHSSVQFYLKHLAGHKMYGAFSEFEDKISFDENNFEKTEIYFAIKTKSITMGYNKHDKFLMSDYFLNVDKYPEIIFQSKSIKKISEDEYNMVGDITIKGITKEIEVIVSLLGIATHPFHGYKMAGIGVKGKLNRFDYNFDWDKLINQVPDLALIREDFITLELNFELMKKE